MMRPGVDSGTFFSTENGETVDAIDVEKERRIWEVKDIETEDKVHPPFFFSLVFGLSRIFWFMYP